MAQPYCVRKTDVRIGPKKGSTVYSARPYYYGTISTADMAKQIAQESALTQADVIGVIERMAYFCQTHMALGYKVALDGLGTFCNDFVTIGSTEKPEDVTAKMVRCVRPKFSPAYTIINGSFRYLLLPERTELVKVNFATGTTTGGDDTSTASALALDGGYEVPAGDFEVPAGDAPAAGADEDSGE